MKKKKIDKTHWIIQFSVLLLSSLLLFLLPNIVNLETLFPSLQLSNLMIIPSLILIFLFLLLSYLKKDSFTKSWFFNDLTYWNIFALFLSLIAIYHFSFNSVTYGIFTQIFAYIALLLGYANEYRNQRLKEKVKKKK